VKVWLSDDARRIPFRIEIVQSMADLINRSLFALARRAVGLECVLFEEETNLVP